MKVSLGPAAKIPSAVSRKPALGAEVGHQFRACAAGAICHLCIVKPARSLADQVHQLSTLDFQACVMLPIKSMSVDSRLGWEQQQHMSVESAGHCLSPHCASTASVACRHAHWFHRPAAQREHVRMICPESCSLRNQTRWIAQLTEPMHWFCTRCIPSLHVDHAAPAEDTFPLWQTMCGVACWTALDKRSSMTSCLVQLHKQAGSASGSQTLHCPTLVPARRQTHAAGQGEACSAKWLAQPSGLLSQVACSAKWLAQPSHLLSQVTC